MKSKSALLWLRREMSLFLPLCMTSYLKHEVIPCWTALSEAHATMPHKRSLSSERKEKFISNTGACLHKQHERQIFTPSNWGKTGQSLAPAKETKALPLLAQIFCKTWSGSANENAGWMSFDLIALPFPLMTHICRERGYLEGRDGFKRNKMSTCTGKQREEYEGEFLSAGRDCWTHLDLPTLPFSTEKTDLYFIGLHTWKNFCPYA